MKNFVFVFLVILMACQPKSKETSKLVSVSLLPQKYFVDQISGGLLEVNVLVPPGSSPHDYSVLPSQMKALSKSKIWFQIGLLTFEDVWRDKFAELNPNLIIVDSSEGMDKIAGHDCEEDHDHAHDHGEGYDPHVWLAPAEAKIMAQHIFNALKTSFPEHASEFEINYQRLDAEIDSLHAYIEQALSGKTNRNFLIFHPTLGYFAREFQLGQIALELNGKEPSPKHMKKIVDTAHEKNIHTILIQKEFDTENALQLSREIDGSVVVIDPLDYDWKKQMLQITKVLADQK